MCAYTHIGAQSYTCTWSHTHNHSLRNSHMLSHTFTHTHTDGSVRPFRKEWSEMLCLPALTLNVGLREVTRTGRIWWPLQDILGMSLQFQACCPLRIKSGTECYSWTLMWTRSTTDSANLVSEDLGIWKRGTGHARDATPYYHPLMAVWFWSGSLTSLNHNCLICQITEGKKT